MTPGSLFPLLRKEVLVMDSNHPYWLPESNQRWDSNDQKDQQEEILVRRNPNEELDPFQIFLMKMDYLNNR